MDEESVDFQQGVARGTVNEVDGGRLGKGSVVHTGDLAAAMKEF
jgi:hypothetical protein